jgi:hypothetical protein
MFGRSINTKDEVAALKRVISGKRFAGREDRWKKILAAPAE